MFQRTGDNGGPFTIGQHADKDSGAKLIPNGTDITGQGKPDVLVSEWSGGAHCCLTHYVFELEPHFRLLAKLEAQDDGDAHFERRGEQGQFYYVAADWTFAYWAGSFAGSPNHEVILAFHDDASGGGYHLALDQMRRPLPGTREWERKLAEVRNDVQTKTSGYFTDFRQSLWQVVLDLIYTGHPELAWKFVREAGPRAQGGHDPTLRDFCFTLRESPYWQDLKPLMEGAPPQCRTALKLARGSTGKGS